MGLEEAAMNQAPVGFENGADRAATSRENPVPSTAPNQYNPNPIFQIGNGFGFFHNQILFFYASYADTLKKGCPSRQLVILFHLFPFSVISAFQNPAASCPYSA